MYAPVVKITATLCTGGQEYVVLFGYLSRDGVSINLT